MLAMRHLLASPHLGFPVSAKPLKKVSKQIHTHVIHPLHVGDN
jgi:hypothetical protein